MDTITPSDNPVNLDAQTARIKAANDIVSIAGEYVRLKRVGATQSYTGLCPFHNEKTASFRVHADRQFFKCFGCGAAGDVFEFVGKVEGISFAEVRRQLAARAGLSDCIPSQPQRAKWAQQRRQLEMDLPRAQYWRRAAMALAEESLVSLKAALFDPTMPQPAVGEIEDMENFMWSLNRIDGAELVAEFQDWLEREPHLTHGMVRAAQSRETVARRSLERYLAAIVASEVAA